MRFQYFEIRACVEINGEVQSFLGEPFWNASIGDYVHRPYDALTAAEAANEAENGGGVFWTLYGKECGGTSIAIGDFKTFEAAEEVMNAILAPMAFARDEIIEHHDADHAAVTLEDFINQCSSSERL